MSHCAGTVQMREESGNGIGLLLFLLVELGILAFPLSGKSGNNRTGMSVNCPGILLCVTEFMFLYVFVNETLMICVCN